MKPLHALTGGGIIALIAGLLGYQLGKHQAGENTGASEAAYSSATTKERISHSAASGKQLEDFASRLDDIQDPVEKFSTALASMEAWVATDPEAALAWLTQQPPTGRRNEVVRLALGQWAESAPKDAAAWSQRHLEGIDLHNTMIRIAEQWAQSDPAAAARWFSTLPEQSRTAPLEGLFFKWGVQDPKAARAFLDSELPTDQARPTFTQAVLAGWAKTAPAEASAQSLEISRQSQNPSLFANTLANWATVDVSSSADWLLENVKPGPERNAALQEMAAMFAHQHPTAGVEWIGNLEAQEQGNAREVLGTEWARTDAKSAAAWLATLPDESVSEDARLTILTNYLTQNEADYENWLQTLPVGLLKSEASRLAGQPLEE